MPGYAICTVHDKVQHYRGLQENTPAVSPLPVCTIICYSMQPMPCHPGSQQDHSAIHPLPADNFSYSIRNAAQSMLEVHSQLLRSLCGPFVSGEEMEQRVASEDGLGRGSYAILSPRL